MFFSTPRWFSQFLTYIWYASMFLDFELSDEQYGHAVAIERLVPSLSYLRTELCSTNMSEACFWKIYFVLLHSKLSKQDAEILSTPQVYSLSSVLFFFLIVFFYHVVSCCSCGLQLPKQKHLLIGLIWTTYIDLVRNKKKFCLCVMICGILNVRYAIWKPFSYPTPINCHFVYLAYCLSFLWSMIQSICDFMSSVSSSWLIQTWGWGKKKGQPGACTTPFKISHGSCGSMLLYICTSHFISNYKMLWLF